MSHEFSFGRISSYKKVFSIIVNETMFMSNYFDISEWVTFPCFFFTFDKLKKTTITIMEFYMRKYYRLL